MAIDYENPKQMKRLVNALDWSKKELAHFQQQRMDALRQYVGHYYGQQGGCEEKIPVNLIHLFCQIYQRRLSVKSLRSLVTTRNRGYRAAAVEYGLAIDHQLNKIKPEAAINTAAQEAMFGIGMVQIGLSGDEIVVKPILFDDMILDLSAKTWDSISYIGHRFRPTLEWAKNNEEYDSKARAKLKGTEIGQDTDSMANEADTQSQQLTLGESRGVQEYADRVDLIQIYLPEEGEVVVMASNETERPLLVKKWKGPPGNNLGMYRKLAWSTVPGNLPPVPPVQLWRDLHDSTNRLVNKVIRQAERQKTILGVQRKAVMDGQKVVAVNDGDAIAMDHPDGINEFTTGGANQTTLGMVGWLRNLASYFAGNADSLGGLAASSGTLGQDQMLFESAGTQIEEMQSMMMDFSSDVVRDVAFWTLNDPILDIELERKIAGTDISFMFNFNPDRLQGDFTDYDFQIDPYSTTRRTPQQRLQAILTFIERVAVPMMPIMQQAGQTINTEALFKLIAQYSDTDEFLDLITFMDGEQNTDPGALVSMMRGATAPKRNGNGRPPTPGKSPLVDAEKAMMGKLMGAGDQAMV